MRDDLRGSWNAVQWADAHIPVLRERFISWQRRNPYELVMEVDPKNADWEFMVAYLRAPLDMSALLTGNGHKPNSSAHFPIRKNAADFKDAVDVLKKKGWIRAREAAAIKRTKAYLGGDKLIYLLHQLDIARKHERLLLVDPTIEAVQITLLGGASFAHHRTLDDKTILYRLPAGRFRPSQGNTLLAAQIFFNEPSLLKTKQPADLLLQNFVFRVRALIEAMP
jgi:hypothetical protein